MRYSGFDDPLRWVLPAVLEEQAARQPDAEWLTMVDGETLTFGQASADVARAAGHFARLGVRPGDRVAVMLPNGLDFVRAWLGLGRLGAVAVFLNTELRGAFLAHQLRNSAVELAVVDAELLLEVLAVADPTIALRRVLVAGDAPPGDARLETRAWDEWRSAAPWDGPLPAWNEVACVMYTSGTSGPAKGVLMPHAHCTLFGVGTIDACSLGDADRYYIVLPLFHVNGLLMQLGATLLAGCPAVVRRRFSASAWIGDIRSHECTITNLLGVLAAFVCAQPPARDDAVHTLRVAINGPNIPAHEAILRGRFGVPDVTSGYGMTEVNIPIWGRLGRSIPGAAGWVYEKHFDLRIVDPETDREVPRGQLGEIVVRPRTPFGFMQGYLNMPDRTVEAWRNLWFHSGDAAFMDDEGLVTFVDRLKDCIRRRGENIAATEVEAVVAALPGVGEVAAYAVPSDLPGGEDEVMLAIVPAPGISPSAEAIGAEAEARLPRYAAPRYVLLVEELPKTSTGKVQRAVLRKRGVLGAIDRMPDHMRRR